MATVYCAIYGDSDYWDGTIAWGYDATSDIHNPTAHANQAARDAQYTAGYTSLYAWEQARDGASQAGDDEIAVIQGPWTSADTTQVAVDGFSSDTVKIIAIGAARHSGVWSETAYRLVASVGDWLIKPHNSNTTFDGFQLHNTVTSDTNNGCFTMYIAYDSLVFSNLIMSAAETGMGIDLRATANASVVYNCIIYCPHSGNEGIRVRSGVANVYNCTIRGFNENAGGLYDAGGTTTAKNCAVMDNNDDFNGFDTIDYCASDDGDGNNSQSGLTWANEFEGYATHDYRLASGSNLIGAGTDNPGTLTDTDDIAGTARSSTWDIGAFEYAAAGGSIVPLASYYKKRRMFWMNYDGGKCLWLPTM